MTGGCYTVLWRSEDCWW